jgi:hypothetical protein
MSGINDSYKLDFGRFFPPEFPNRKASRQQIFYYFLRPEFLLKYSKPLCSDALSGFISTKYDSNNEKYIEDIKQATNYLKKSTIPQFVSYTVSYFQVKSNLSIFLLKSHRKSFKNLSSMYQYLFISPHFARNTFYY